MTPLEGCNFVSLFIGGIAGISCVDPVLCHQCLAPSQFLQDMVWRHGSEKVTALALRHWAEK